MLPPDGRDKHHWSQVVINRDEFQIWLLAQLGVSEAAYLDYVVSVRRYRDKFVAHLDADNTMHIPMLDIAQRAVVFYHQHLISEEVDDPLATFRLLPASSEELTIYLDQHSRAAVFTYDRVLPASTGK